jgi:large subunit ribosomal protein L24
MAETKTKMHVRKGDKVVIIAGKDKDRQGKIIQAIPKKARVVVEGVNTVKRHTKPSQKLPQGGIITKEAPLAVSNVMLICPACNKPTRIAKKLVNDNYVRACKKCGEIIDRDK